MISVIFVVPLAVFIYRVLIKPSVILSHLEMFTLGMLIYCALPIGLALTTLPIHQPAFSVWQKIVRVGGMEPLETLAIWALMGWAAFLVGSRLGAPYQRSTITHQSLDPQFLRNLKRTIIAMTLFLALFALYWGLSNRGLLFQGYKPKFEVEVAGPLQTAILLQTVLLLFALTLRHTMGRMTMILCSGSLVFMVLLSLSIGTRQASLVALISVISLVSWQRHGIKRKQIIGLGLAGLSILSLISAWRIGTLSLTSLLLTPVYEPMFTFFSGISFVVYNHIGWFEAPMPLLVAFINLVPSAIWPDKIDLLKSVMEEFTYVSPLGATHIAASMLMNFGWVGSIIVFFLAGFGVMKLALLAQRQWIAMPSYHLFIGILAADIWRNAFQISVVKSGFQSGLLFPLVVIAIATLFTHLQKAHTHSLKPLSSMP